MKSPIKTKLLALLVAASLSALGSVMFMAHVHLLPAQAQITQETSAVTIAALSSVEEITATLTMTDFDNTIFILSLSVRPERFVECVDNPYFPLLPGTIYHYESDTDEGLETTTVTVTNQTKTILGITATVVHDTVRLEGEVKEDTLDWFAQDKSGNVWYMGEVTAEYEDGEIVGTEGSWEAGVQGSKPGILMLDEPVVGDIYRQEYLKDEAIDMGSVLSLDEPASVPFADFARTLVTLDYNPLGAELEHKYYAPGIGFVLDTTVEGSDPNELVAISHSNSMQVANHTCGDDGGTAFVGTIFVPPDTHDYQALAQISAGEAEQAALLATPAALVTQTRLERRGGFLVYSIHLDNGDLVIVDAGDGVLLRKDAAGIAQPVEDLWRPLLQSATSVHTQVS